MFRSCFESLASVVTIKLVRAAHCGAPRIAVRTWAVVGKNDWPFSNPRIDTADSGCHCASADHSLRVVGSGSVASSSELFTVVRPSIWDKSSDIKIGQWGRPWLVWYVPCKRRCVSRFTKLKHWHRHRNDRRRRCETHSVGTQWQSVGEPHDAIFTVSDEQSLESPI